MLKWVLHFACSNLYIFCMNFVYTHIVYMVLMMYTFCISQFMYIYKMYTKYIPYFNILLWTFCLQTLVASFLILYIYKMFTKVCQNVGYIMYVIYFVYIAIAYILDNFCTYNFEIHYHVGTPFQHKWYLRLQILSYRFIMFWEKFTIRIWKRWKWTVKRKFVY